ncbi:MAG: hypothetical protein AB1384_11330 [Actinomycetota bacterium]
MVNADVFTSDTTKPRARAVAVKDGRITYVGAGATWPGGRSWEESRAPAWPWGTASGPAWMVSSGHTSYMFKPFSDAPGEYGDVNWSRDGWNRVMEIIDGMGLQACTHACGDAGIHRVIASGSCSPTNWSWGPWTAAWT